MLNLNIPQMLPDELGTAYLEHVALGNTLTTVELLSRVYNAKPRLRRPSRAQLIAEIAGLSDQDFVCSHTCKPFYGAFEPFSRWCHPHGINERERRNNPISRHRRNRYYFCKQCTSEDIDTFGRTYWRRSHQIAGVCWCSTHQTTLSAICPDSLSIQPHKLIDYADLCIPLPFPSECSVAGRYQTLAMALLDCRRPLYLPLLTTVLNHVLNKQNYSHEKIRHGKSLLSDTVLKSCQNQWSQDIFFNFSKKIPGQYFREIDEITIPQVDRSTLYALALAILYDTPEEAMNIIANLFTWGQNEASVNAIKAHLLCDQEF